MITDVSMSRQTVLNDRSAVRRIVIVEDHPIFAEALARMVAGEQAFDVVATERTVKDALVAVRALRPDLLLLDQHLPDGKGDEIVRAMKREQPLLITVMLTGDDSEETLIAALEAGVAGFIAKGERSSRIIELLHLAANGEIVIPTADLSRLLARQRSRMAAQAERDRARQQLTPREFEVLQLMAQGLDNHVIAARTQLRVNTIRTHVQRVLEKLHTHTRLEAVLRATALGMISPLH